MAINLLNGQMLNANLERDGSNIAIVNSANATPALFVDVVHNRIAVNAASATVALTVGGDATANNIALLGTVSAAGNVRGGNINTTGAVNATSASITGNITGGNISTTGTFNADSISVNGNVLAQNMSVSGNINAGNIITAGTGGNITGANVISTITLTASGNIYGNNISLSGNVDAGIFNVGNLVVIDTAVLPSITGLTNGNITITPNGTGVLNLSNLSVTNTTIESQSAGNLVGFGGTSGIAVPYGNSTQRPANTTPVGTTRFNTVLSALETWTGNTWVSGGSVPAGTVLDQQITPDGTSVSYTLNQSATNNNIIVSINGVLQRPTVSYDVVGTTITFAQAPLTNDIVDIRFIAYTSTVDQLNNTSGNGYIIVNTDSSIDLENVGGSVNIDTAGNVNISGNVAVAEAIDTGSILTNTYLFANGQPFAPAAVATANFSIQEVGNKLVFYYGATPIASMDQTGAIVSASTITPNSTP